MRRLRGNRQAVSMAFILIMTGVSIVGAIVIGLAVLSYNDNGMSEDFSYYVLVGPVVHDGAVEGRCLIPIDSRVGTPFSTFDLMINNKTSGVTLAELIGNESAWKVEGMSIYVDDVNNDGRCNTGDQLVLTYDADGPEKTIDLVVRNAKFGMKLSEINFVIRGDAEPAVTI